MNALLRPPSIDALMNAPIRASIYLLASAAHCSKAALQAEHSDLFDFTEAQLEDGVLPSTLSIAAKNLDSSLAELLRAVALYQAALQVCEGERCHSCSLPF